MKFPDFVAFAECELRAGMRELRVDGQVQNIEPRVFDLLVFLIEHRHRVVPRAELLDKVWGGTPVSDSVISHSVMKARKAIGDTIGDRPLIRTVHRVGYRFVGTLDSGTDPAPTLGPGSAIGAPARATRRIGLLPCRNDTGRSALDWVEAALPALVGQALDADRRLTILPADALVEALASTSALPPAASTGASLANVFGLDCVIRMTLATEGERLRLDYHADGADAGWQGSVLGADPAAMSAALIDRIEAQLFPDDEVPRALQLVDEVAQKNFVRALEACERERWRSASHLLHVVLDIEPGFTAAAVKLLGVLAALHDRAAFALGERLLQEASAHQDDRVAALVHHGLGQAHMYMHGPTEQARLHMREALQLALHSGDAEWAARICVAEARYEQYKRNFGRARELYGHVVKSSLACGNRLQLMTALHNVALQELLCGNLLGARQSWEDSLAICRELGMETTALANRCNLAQVTADLGFLAQASATCADLVAHAGSVQSYRVVANMLLSVCFICSDAYALPQIDAALLILQRRHADEPSAGTAELQLARGIRAVCAGEFDAACAFIAPVLEGALELGNNFLLDQWLPLLLRTQWQADRGDGARRTLSLVRALPGFAADEGLQGLLAYAQGVERHAGGDRDAAATSLRQAIEWLPMGRWSAYARLDAAWLQLEAGDPVGARRLLRDIQPWLQDHPVGWLVGARLSAAQGRWDDAAQQHGRYLAAARGRATGEQVALLDLYRRAVRADVVELPPTARLPASQV